MKAVKTKKDIRVEKSKLKEFRRSVKRASKLSPEDLPQCEYRYYERHDIRSRPIKYPNGWMVSFMVLSQNDVYHSGQMSMDDLKPTIGEAHLVGFAMARAIISGNSRGKLNDFTESECDAIERFRVYLKVKSLAVK